MCVCVARMLLYTASKLCTRACSATPTNVRDGAFELK